MMTQEEKEKKERLPFQGGTMSDLAFLSKFYLKIAYATENKWQKKIT